MLKTAFTFSPADNADWRRNSLGEIINQHNIDSFIPKLTPTEIPALLQNIRNTSTSAQTDTGAWDRYFTSLNRSDQGYLVNLIRNTEDLTRLTGQDLVKANQDACESAIAHNEAIRQSIKEQSLSAKATNFLAGSLAALGNMAAFALISKGISLIARKIDQAAHSAEYCGQRVDNLMSSYESSLTQANNSAKSIESLAARYEELSMGVNNLGENISLSGAEYEEYLEIVNQIADMFPSLIQGYTDEGNAILSVKGNVEQLRDAYNTLIISGENSDWDVKLLRSRSMRPGMCQKTSTFHGLSFAFIKRGTI